MTMLPELALRNVLSLVRQGHVHHTLEHALSAAGKSAVAALDKYRSWDGPMTPEKATQRFLEAVQAAREELDRLALAVAEWMVPAKAEG
jgi:hypothetical protein